ncbi:MAG: outer membrane lipoprotein LolB [Betaproteobacteria bacterium]|nr:outer membrane lipoprotein LolB [Betaproteobacteria bacterium]
MRLAAALGACLLAGCALAPTTPPPARDMLAAFAVDARFALVFVDPARRADNSGGRLTWEHRPDGDRILIANPLGIGVAEIESVPGRATLRAADGRNAEAADADSLIAAVTGQPLPAQRLPDWLRGRGNVLARDAGARPLRLDEDGWRVDFSYAGDAPDALPSALVVARPGEFELRLRIDEWRNLP